MLAATTHAPATSPWTLCKIRSSLHPGYYKSFYPRHNLTSGRWTCQSLTNWLDTGTFRRQLHSSSAVGTSLIRSGTHTNVTSPLRDLHYRACKLPQQPCLGETIESC